MSSCRNLSHSSLYRSLALAVLTAMLASGCMSPEQRMVLKIEGLMEQQKYDGALSYLERYLGRYGKSLAAWRFRVLIRLEQEQRATAAAEYASLNAALGRHEPNVLREVVLGAGGRWLLSDYTMLARCANGGLADAAFFKELLSAQHLGRGSMSKVAVSDDEIAAVLDALPGSLDTGTTWPIVEAQAKSSSVAIRSRLVAAAARHLAAGGLSEPAQSLALTWITKAAADADPRLREAAVHASLLLPEGAGRLEMLGHIVDSLSTAGDAQRAASMFLLHGERVAGGWSQEQLQRWSRGEGEPVATLSVAVLQRREPSGSQARRLNAAATSKSPGKILAAATGPEGKPETAWASLHVEDRRLWSAAMARSSGAEQRKWAELALADSDAPVVQAAAEGLALVLDTTSEDSTLIEPLRTALTSRDASSRAAAARVVILRHVHSLLPELEALARRSDERVLLTALDAVIETGAPGWDSLIAAGLESDIALVREKAVDAAASGCSTAQHTMLTELLTDADPHVAVRAAAVLYLSVGVQSN